MLEPKIELTEPIDQIKVDPLDLNADVDVKPIIPEIVYKYVK